MARRITQILVFGPDDATGSSAIQVNGKSDLLMHLAKAPRIREEFPATVDLSLVVFGGSPWGRQTLKKRQVLHLVYDDGTRRGFRIRSVRPILTRSTNGGGLPDGAFDVEVRADSILRDLADWRLFKTLSPSTVTTESVALTGLTTSQVLSAILSSEWNAPTWFQPAAIQPFQVASQKPQVMGVGMSALEAIDMMCSRLTAQGKPVTYYEPSWNASASKWEIRLRVEPVSPDATTRPAHAPNGGSISGIYPNLLELAVEDEAGDYFSRLMPVAGDLHIGIQKARFEVDSEEATDDGIKLYLKGDPIQADSQMVGLHAGRSLSGLGWYEVLSSGVAEGGDLCWIEIADDREPASRWPGVPIAFALDSSANETPYLVVKDREDAYGTKTAPRLLFQDISPYENEIVNEGWSADLSTFSSGVAVGWEIVGAATGAEESQAQFVTHGSKSQKVTTSEAGEGIQLSAYTFEPTDEVKSISFWVRVIVQSGRVRLVAKLDEKDGDGERTWPAGEQQIEFSALTPNEAGISFNLPDGWSGADINFQLLDVSGGSVFYVDAATLTLSTAPQPYAADMGPAALFREGARYLATHGIDHARYRAKVMDQGVKDAPESAVQQANALGLYSLRKLFVDYRGYCVRLRRDSDDAVKDFGFLNGYVDTEAIAAWAGEEDVFVVRWYDQSGNGRHAAQSTAAAQPQLVLAAADGLPEIVCDGDDDYMVTGALGAATTTLHVMSVFALKSFTSEGSADTIYDVDSASDAMIVATQSGTRLFAGTNNSADGIGSVYTLGDRTQTSALYDPAGCHFRRDGALVGAFAATTTLSGSSMTIGVRGNLAAGSFANVAFREFVAYTTAQEKEAAIEADQMASWGMSGTIPSPPGGPYEEITLGDYVSLKAAPESGSYEIDETVRVVEIEYDEDRSTRRLFKDLVLSEKLPDFFQRFQDRSPIPVGTKVTDTIVPASRIPHVNIEAEQVGTDGVVTVTIVDPASLVESVEMRTASGRNLEDTDAYAEVSPSDGEYVETVALVEGHVSFIQVKVVLGEGFEPMVFAPVAFDADVFPNVAYSYELLFGGSGKYDVYLNWAGDEDTGSIVWKFGSGSNTVAAGRAGRVKVSGDGVNPGSSFTITATGYSEGDGTGVEAAETYTVTATAPSQAPAVQASNISGIVAANKLLESAQKFASNITFSSSSESVVSWGSGTLRLTNGNTYAISSGNTGTMSAGTTYYIYWDGGGTTTQFQATTNPATATGDRKIVVCVAWKSSISGDSAHFTPAVGMADNPPVIAAAAIQANVIRAIQAEITQLSALAANIGTAVVDDELVISESGVIRSGATAYGTGTGIWIEYNGGTPRFRVGNPSGNQMRWTGSALEITGTIHATGGSFSGTLEVGDGGEIAWEGGKITKTGIRFDADDSQGSYIQFVDNHIRELAGDLLIGGVSDGGVTISSGTVTIEDLGGGIQITTDGAFKIDGIEIDVSGATTGTILGHDGTKIAARSPTSAGLVVTGSSNQSIAGTKNFTGVLQAGGNSVLTTGSSIGSLTDVTISSAATNHVMKHDGSKWVNGAITDAMLPATISIGKIGNNPVYVSSGFMKFTASALTSSPPVSQTNTFIPVDMNGTTYYIRLYST